MFCGKEATVEVSLMLCNRNICTQATDLFKEQAHSQWQQTRHGPAAWTSRLPPMSVRTGLRIQTAATTGPLYLKDKDRARLEAAGSNSSTHRLFCHDNHHIQLNIMKLQAQALHMKFQENPTTHPQISLILQSQNSVGTRPFLWSSIRNSSMRPSADIDVQALTSKDYETKIKVNLTSLMLMSVSYTTWSFHNPHKRKAKYLSISLSLFRTKTTLPIYVVSKWKYRAGRRWFTQQLNFTAPTSNKQEQGLQEFIT